jgi:hypothetical protein
MRVDIDGRRRHEVRVDGLARAVLIGAFAVLSAIVALCYLP